MTGCVNEVKTASFGAGCFWGIEAAFRKVPGVTATAAGYMGGTTKNPTYEQVCSGGTGHAEVVQVMYDPARVSYEDLLPDVGSNYRSVIFYHDADQARAARKSRDELQVSGRFGFGKIVTAIQPATEFWRAEEYHQQYFEKHGGHGACGI
jgi:peptide-methionine (S)-S-oxide reductase